MLRAVTQSLKVVSIAVIAGLIVIGGLRFFSYYKDKASAEEHIGQRVVVTIGKSDSEADVAKKLHDSGLINSELYFKALMKLNNGSTLVPNTYVFTIGTSTSTILNDITTTKSTAQVQVKNLKLTIPEGWRTTQIADQLDAIGWPPGGQAFLDAVKNYTGTQYAWLKDRPDKHSLEGYLFPDTYDITTTTTADTIIGLMLDNFDQKFDSGMRAQAKTDNLSIAQIVTLASIVEREAVVGSERPLIAGVYMNRITSKDFMGADPTVQYAVGKEGDWWPVLSTKDLSVSSPYNTYKNTGLPPTPIANPGLPSILAALQPTQTDYYYFVAKDDGSNTHAFEVTDQEHEADRIKYGNIQDGGNSSGNSTQIQPTSGNGGG